MTRTNRHLRLWGSLSLAIASCVLAACADEFADDSARPPRRAIESPLGLSSPNSEVMGRPIGVVPLVTVDLPNRKEDQPQLHTIADSFAPLAQTAPASRPARATAASPGEETPDSNISLRVVEKKNAADTITATINGEKATLSIVSESGIGSATLERAGDTWPPSITVQFSHETRAFARLEGFSASELTSAGNKVALRVEISTDTATATILVPAFVRSSRISLDWVEESR